MEHPELREYKMDAKMADDILQNVLKAGNKKPSSVPVYQIELKKKLTKAPYIYGIVISAIALVLTLLAPLAFARPFLPMSVTTSAAQAGFYLEGSYAIDGVITLHVSSADLDLKHSYLQTNSGTVYEPLDFNASTREIFFPFPEEESNIYVVTRQGAVLHLLLTPGE